MVGRMILAISAASAVVLVVIFVVVPWVTKPAPTPTNATFVVQPRHDDRRASEDEAMRRWLSSPPLPLTGYRKW